ncbi:MAG: PaaI family thioesterase [Chloroflexi bacterium]|nr:PaaI family thioesterase [Chloroflexota bacterium]MDA1239277.1 PaaI family thioesterase [Chloroflexota bacterium]
MPEVQPSDDAFSARYYDQICFACGDRNPHGLHLRFARDGDAAVVATFTPREVDQGFPGVLHGGILAALVDEAMAWSMWAADRALGVTAKMEMRYRRPVPPDGPLTVRGRVARQRGRRFEVEASIADASGEVLVEAAALFLRLSPEEETRMASVIGWATADD